MVECPTCGKASFDSDRAMKIHHTKVHGDGDRGIQYPELWDREDLTELYWERELSQRQIAERIGCSRTAVQRAMNALGIEKRDSGPREGRYNPAWNGGMVTIECEYCGDERELIPSKQDRRFCSTECFGNWMEERDIEDHPRWQGGISNEPYGPEWTGELRRRVRERDGYKCVRCGISQTKYQEIRGRKLDVHHIDGDKKNNTMENLITLCQSCHQKWEVIPIRPELDSS